MPAFGEAVLYMKVPKRMRKLPKYEDRWDTGVHVGLKDGTNDVRVLTPMPGLTPMSGLTQMSGLTRGHHTCIRQCNRHSTMSQTSNYAT